MKVLHCIWAEGGGGAERQLSFLAPALATRGYNVHVAFVFPGVNSVSLADGPCVLHQIAASNKRDPLIAGRLLSLVRTLRPDVIQTWLTQMDILGGGVAKVLGIPWILSERSDRLNYPPSLLNRLRTVLGRRATIVVANSPGGANYWASLGVPLERIEIIRNCVAVREIENANPIADPRLGAGDDVVLVVGRLSREKNLNSVIVALQELRRRRAHVKMVFCGEGPLLGSLQAQVRDRGLVECVIFAGFVSNVAAWLKRASALVAIPLWEGHPSATLEAMAAGLPVVVSDIPAFRSILDDESAWFVPADDPRAVARALDDALTAHGEASRRALNAKRRLDGTSLSAMVGLYEDIYRRATHSLYAAAGDSEVIARDKEGATNGT